MSLATQRPARPDTDPPRRRILDAAVRCFARSGFHGASMHEICSQAEMSPGALYRHFPSKDAIIEAIAGEERERNRHFFAQLEVEERLLETLLDVGFRWMRDVVARDGTALCAEVLSEAQRNPKIRDIFEKNLREVRDAIKQALTRARDQGEIDTKLDLEIVTTVILAIGDGLIVRLPFEPDMTPDRIEPSLRDLIRRMLAPVQPASTGSTQPTQPASSRNQT